MLCCLWCLCVSLPLCLHWSVNCLVKLKRPLQLCFCTCTYVCIYLTFLLRVWFVAEQQHGSRVDFPCLCCRQINSTQRPTSVKRHLLLIPSYQQFWSIRWNECLLRHVSRTLKATISSFTHCTNPTFILKISQDVQIIPETLQNRTEQIRAVKPRAADDDIFCW